jgi:tetratricopeptide (TPR) repeat protein
MDSAMTIDFNLLDQRASTLMERGAYSQALKIYLHMADGDPSLDAGHLGFKIGECYEHLGDRHAAKYWYGRAVEENPTIEKYVSARKRLWDPGIDHFLT